MATLISGINPRGPEDKYTKYETITAAGYQMCKRITPMISNLKMNGSFEKLGAPDLCKQEILLEIPLKQMQKKCIVVGRLGDLSRAGRSDRVEILDDVETIQRILGRVVDAYREPLLKGENEVAEREALEQLAFRIQRIKYDCMGIMGDTREKGVHLPDFAIVVPEPYDTISAVAAHIEMINGPLWGRDPALEIVINGLRFLPLEVNSMDVVQGKEGSLPIEVVLGYGQEGRLRFDSDQGK